MKDRPKQLKSTFFNPSWVPLRPKYIVQYYSEVHGKCRIIRSHSLDGAQITAQLFKGVILHLGKKIEDYR